MIGQMEIPVLSQNEDGSWTLELEIDTPPVLTDEERDACDAEYQAAKLKRNSEDKQWLRLCAAYPDETARLRRSWGWWDEEHDDDAESLPAYWVSVVNHLGEERPLEVWRMDTGWRWIVSGAGVDLDVESPEHWSGRYFAKGSASSVAKAMLAAEGAFMSLLD